ncbi:tRNA pseudouridine(55) synthase TruB [Bacteroidetes/Chlorobi group bacterium Naka2016]|jgi:tRNA pseudouridine55 synthase|nr:MAG: tRNA pseudouridine(55) synthase TruB [Bacteroidetes/Chlorobi group bacterium Naka2016]
MILTKTNIKDLSYWLNKTYEFGSAVLIDKPKDWTSFDVVNKLKKVLRIRKIGHTGTLDPFATGLLILLLNKFTKKQQEFTNLDKTYIAKIKLGATTKTFDPTSEEENLKNIDGITNQEIESVIKSLVGDYEQIPPMYSAKKVSGQRLYQLARRNQEIELKPVLVKIHSIEIFSIEPPFVEFEVKCSKGTYIRSLANDIGKKLGVGAYLFELRRTQIGNFSVNNAFKMEEFLTELKKVS